MKKIIKLSVAAALAATAMNAAVVDNVKLDGKARLFYETNNANGTDMFDANNAGTKGQVLLTVGASADVGPIKVNLRNQTLTTAGLENAVVAANQTAGTDNINYTDIANIQATFGGTTVIAGKQELNTPMCFTEGWNIHRNTFKANVLVNKSLISGTTLVFADVKSTNASGASATPVNVNTILAEKGAGLDANGDYNRNVGATMVAAHTTIAGLPLNAYFYDINSVAGTTPLALSTTWLDTNFNVAGAKIAAIYAEQDLNDGSAEGTAAAVSVATKVAGLNVFAAYSTVNDDATSFANVATQKKTKLPTQAVYVDGADVAQAGADTWKVKLSGMSVGPVKLAIQHVVCDTNGAEDTETDIIATTKIGGVSYKALLMQNEEGAGTQHEKFRLYANYSF